MMTPTLWGIDFWDKKYIFPTCIYVCTLLFEYLFFTTEVKVPETRRGDLETTTSLNPNLPHANVNGDIGGKRDNMRRSYGDVTDHTAMENIERNEDLQQREDYDSRYSDDEIASLDSVARELQERIKASANLGNAMMNDSDEIVLTEADRLVRNKQREEEALDELNRALAEARLKGLATPQSPTPTLPKREGEKLPDDEQQEEQVLQVTKVAKPTSSYFNTLADNEPEPQLIKAIIDEDIKAVDGSRVRLRLLDDIDIGGNLVKKGTYLYAIMSGFGQQRVKGKISSLLVDDEIVKINLSIYDTDGLEGLYVPSSAFCDTGKDIASSALSGNTPMSSLSASNTFTQWGIQTAQNAYQKTNNAISKAIKKNKATLKYGSFVYLVNSNGK